MKEAVQDLFDNPLLDYFREQIHQFCNHSLMFFVSVLLGGGLWKNAQDQWEGIILTQAFFWYPTMWLIAWTCGTMWALKESRWSRQRATHGVWRLIGGMFMLVIAHGLKSFPFGEYPASIIEIGVVFNEGYNALENASGLTGISWLKSLVRTSRARMEDKFHRLLGAVAEVKEQQTVILATVTEVKSATETLIPVVVSLEAKAETNKLSGESNTREIRADVTQTEALEDRVKAIEDKE